MSERKESNLHNESQILTHYRYATLRLKFPILTNKELKTIIHMKKIQYKPKTIKIRKATFTSGCVITTSNKSKCLFKTNINETNLFVAAAGIEPATFTL